jgi:anti-sigma B factor antagonist
MRIGERRFGDAVVLDLAGAIVGGKARTAIDEAVRRHNRTGTHTLVVNLGGVPSMDLAGLSTLVDACRRIRQAGGVLRLACVTKRIGDLLVITRLLTVFDTFDSVEDAVGMVIPADAGKPDAPKAPLLLLETVHRFLRRA